MQDIRKPYTRSRSNNDLQSRVEQFESARYRRDSYSEEVYDEEPVQIPVKKSRRDLKDMDMYPKKYRDDDLYEEPEYEDGRTRSPYRDQRARPVKKKTSFGTLAFIASIVLLVGGVSLYTYVFDSATITIVPKYKDISEIDRLLTFSKDGTDPSAIPFVIGSTSLSKTKTLKVSETRKVEAKAAGVIIVYNNFDGNAQKLIKNTRFESSKGKIYRINQSIEVPGKKGGEPGSIEVTVYADNSGPDYNLDSGIFSVPGFKGSPREGAFYAKTKDAIIGGASGSKSLVALSDLNAAKDSLAVELAKEIQIDIKKIKKDGYVSLYSAVDITYTDNEAEVLRGDTEVYQVTAKGSVILASAPKLAEAIAKTLGDYDNQPVRLTYIDALNYTRKQTDRIAEGSSTIPILVEGKPRVVWESNIETLKEMVAGKKRDDFKPLMKTISSIESAEISFSPLWLSRFPSDKDKLVVTESLPKR
jgi:hypothetical protein